MICSNVRNNVTAPATVTWTNNIPGFPVVRDNTLSLYLDRNISNNAAYEVLLSSNI
ncbi:hypothetical protein ABET51_20995 [Metabacillus fastidiosus]|uniref:hypothetical protein n=1 Tax=Metabacillus fastidiosus TaxID=1458 RepID=UPI003D2CFFCF